jgi:membrane protease YdiL (CAAX protease family)
MGFGLGSTMIQRRSIVWFLGIAFSLAWVLFLLPLAAGDPTSLTRQTAITFAWAAAMWMPGLAAILVRRFVDRESLAKLNLTHLGDLRMYLWAWLLPLVLALLAGIATWLLRLGSLDLEFKQLSEAMGQTPGGNQASVQAVVGIQIAAAISFAPLINMLFALGEELGWRGYLLPRLMPLGQGRAIVLSGVIWGIWHAPAILQGYNYPTQPVLGVFFMIVFCVLLGAILSWLYLRTQSPWAPALAHGAVNAVAGLPLLFLSGVDISFGGTLASLAGWIPLGLFVGWLVWSRRLPVLVNSEQLVESSVKD